MEWGTLAAWLAFLAPRLNKRKSRFNPGETKAKKVSQGRRGRRITRTRLTTPAAQQPAYLARPPRSAWQEGGRCQALRAGGTQSFGGALGLKIDY